MTDDTITLPDSLDIETASEVLGEYAQTEDAQIIPGDTIESLRNEVEELSSVFREALQENKELSEAAVNDLSVEALTAEFRDEDGDIQVEALAQRPETKSNGSRESLSPEAEELVEQYGDGDPEEATEALQERYQNFKNMGWDSKADQAKDELETLGVEA